MSELLLREIAAAFPTEPRPQTLIGDERVRDHDDPRHLLQLLHGKAWTEIRDADFVSASRGFGAFTFLDVEAKRYYLPGFMSAAIRLGYDADILLNDLELYLGSDTETAWLTHPQRDLVTKVVHHLADRLDDPNWHALAQRW